MKNIDTEIAGALAYKGVGQLGFVVTDLSRALDNFAGTLGIRKWYRARPSDKDAGEVYYRGGKIDSDYDFVLGSLGGMQFEIIAVGGKWNIYHDHLEKHGEGLQHISFFVSDFDRKMAAYKKIGVEAIQSGRIVSKSGSVTRFAYFDNSQSNGITVEITETKIFGITVKTTPFMMRLGGLIGDLEIVKW